MRRLTLSALALFGLLLLPACGGEEIPDGYEDGSPVAEGKADGFIDSLRASAPLPADAVLDAPLAVLFAPDDPVSTLELTLIEEIAARREADPAAHEEGENPFTIRYAVYNLRNERITDALIDAAARGVDVQVLIEADQLDPARDYNQMDERLIDAGFEYAPDHRALDEGGRREADLIGVTGSGLMHLKTRIFQAPGFEAVISGSMNPGDNAVLNEETLHLIRDPALIARYDEAYRAVLEDRRVPNVWDEGAALNVLFTPAASGPRAGTRLLQWLQEEDEQILLMVYSLRDVTAAGVDGSLVDILKAKAKAGVPVYLITDRKQSDGVDADGNPVYRNDRTEDRLRGAGVHVYEVTNRATPFTAMHHKVAILGRTRIRVITDAANYSYAALGSDTRTARNHESMLFVDTAAAGLPHLGRRYLGQWMKVLERYADQSADEDEAPFGVVAAELLAQAGWPDAPVGFTATAQTEWGESVHVRGDAERLGAWGERGEGVPLFTDATSYPFWTTLEDVPLPVGAIFAWKVTAVSESGATRWEAGPNRRSLAMDACLLGGGARFHGDWR
ncbi:MAG: phospholipase D-like domain-containing protein [Deltaproteobacteria bacterium]|nr:phospholipase D-like domain-containing protein [Deltaproteobacteria bacterium]